MKSNTVQKNAEEIKMKVYKLHKEQFLKISAQEAWDYISSPANLKEITPDYMGFTILSDLSAEMYAGQIITYFVKPVLGIPMRWCTEITHVQEGEYFVDEQRFGPYKMWHHEHHIKEENGGVVMTDIIHYAIPFGYLGRIAKWLFVGKQLEGIFKYRFECLEKKFNQ